MSTENGSSSHGITFIGALQVLFIGLKLTGYVDWPWPAVLAPILAELVIIGVALLILGVAAFKEWR